MRIFMLAHVEGDLHVIERVEDRTGRQDIRIVDTEVPQSFQEALAICKANGYDPRDYEPRRLLKNVDRRGTVTYAL